MSLHDTIRETLLAHDEITEKGIGGFLVRCECGEVVDWLADHQAEVVAAALTEGGRVQWGVMRKADGRVTPHASEDSARNYIFEGEATVSRAVGPWSPA